MSNSGFIAVFLIGLLGGTHCLAMCGGIVGALSAAGPAGLRRGPAWRITLAYNLGRLGGYAIAGAVVGGIGGLGLLLEDALPVQLVLYVAANLLLLGLALYLAGVTRFMAPLERVGQGLWQRIQPATRRYLPVRRVAQALPVGLLWGFLPCGMVYSALALALLTGSAGRGAALMLVFGLGTLPNLLAASWLLTRFKAALRGRPLRLASAALVGAMAIAGLINAGSLGGRLWAGVVCRL